MYHHMHALFFYLSLVSWACADVNPKSIDTSKSEGATDDNDSGHGSPPDSESATERDTKTDSDTGTDSDAPADTENHSDSVSENDTETDTDTEYNMFSITPVVDIDLMTADDETTYLAGNLPSVSAETVVTLGEADSAQTVTLLPNGYPKKFISKFDAQGNLVSATFITIKAEYAGEILLRGLYPSAEHLFVVAGTNADTTIAFNEQEDIDLNDEIGSLFITKIAANGETEWTRRTTAHQLTSAVTDEDGITAFFRTYDETRFESGDTVVTVSEENTRGVLVRYDLDGNLVFAHPIVSFDIQTICLSDGSFLLYGDYREPVTFHSGSDAVQLPPILPGVDSGFIARYSADGELLFSRSTISHINQRTVFVDDNRIYVFGAASETMVVLDGDEGIEMPTDEDTVNLVFASFDMNGALLNFSKIATTSTRVCSVNAVDSDGKSNNIVLYCSNELSSADSIVLGGSSDSRTVPLPAETVMLIGAGFEEDGTLVKAQTLLSFKSEAFSPWNSPVMESHFGAEALTIRYDHSPPLRWGNSDGAITDTPDVVFDTKIGVFDTNFQLVTVHRIRTIENRFLDEAGEATIHAVNEYGFVRFDEVLSVKDTAFVAKYSDADGPAWIAAAGLKDSRVYPGPQSTAVVTTSTGRPVQLGNEATRVTLAPPTDSVTTYLGRLDNETGALISHRPILNLTSSMDTSDWAALTECTDEVLTVEQAALYRNYELPNRLREAVWHTVSDWVSPSCLVPCEPTEGCSIRADCTSKDGIHIQLTFSEHLLDTYYSYEDAVVRDVSLTAANDEADWTQIVYSDKLGNDGGLDNPSRLCAQNQVSWQGTLLDELPFDGELSFDFCHTTKRGDIDDGSTLYTFAAGTCDIGRKYSYEMGSVINDTVQINDHTYEAVPSSDDPQVINGYVDNECAAIIHPETWEILGRCGIDDAP